MEPSEVDFKAKGMKGGMSRSHRLWVHPKGIGVKEESFEAKVNFDEVED